MFAFGVLVFFVCFCCCRVEKSVLFGQFFSTASCGEGNDIKETPDLGYVVVATSNSYDPILIKFHSNLTLEWVVSVDAVGSYMGVTVEITSDGGYIVAGYAPSGFTKIFKLYPNGTHEWSVVIDEVKADKIGDWIKETHDGGYVVGGVIQDGSQDSAISKLYPNGTMNWTSTIPFGDPCAVDLSNDGGYFLVGQAYYGCGGDPSYNDFGVSKFNSSGGLEKCRIFGGDDRDDPYSAQTTSDGGLIIAGTSESSFSSGQTDIFLVKLDEELDLEWALVLGGGLPDYDEAFSVFQTSDGGYIITGWAETFSTDLAVVLVKFTSSGFLEWAKKLGGVTDTDEGCSVIEASNGAILVSGCTETYGWDSSSSLFLSVIAPDDDLGAVGCEWEDFPSNFQPVFVTSDVIVATCSGGCDPTGPSPTLTPTHYISPNVRFVDAVDLNVKVDCEEYSCFGKFGSFACSSRGSCVDLDVCACDAGYYGIECEISVCNGLKSNDSDVCLGQGKCLDTDTCGDCFYNYFGDQCEHRQPVSFYGTLTLDSSAGKDVIVGFDGSIYFSGEGIVGKIRANNATFEWGWRILDAQDTYYLTIVEGRNGSLTLIGGSFNVVDKCVVLRFNSSGVFMWGRSMGDFVMCSSGLSGVSDGPGSSFIGGGDITSDDGVVFTGYTLADNHLFLAKLFSNGTLAFVTKVGGSGDDKGRSVKQTACLGYIVTGSSKSTESGSRDVLLVKFDESGDFEWGTTMGSSTHSDEGIQVVEASNKWYIVTGIMDVTGMTGTENRGVFLAKYSPVGSLYWVVFLNSFLEGGSDLKEMSDGSIIVAGTAYGGYWKNPFLMKFGPDGSYTWAKSLDSDENRMGYAVAIAPDDGFILVGKHDTIEGKAFIAKTYLDGDNCADWNDRIYTSIVYTDLSTTLFSSPWIPTIQEDVIAEALVKFTSHSPAMTFLSQPTTELVLECMVGYMCFGVTNTLEACSGNGVCKGYDHCECSENYYGENCEITYCYDTLSNYTDEVCGGHGSCVDHDECVCDSDYTYYKDCTMWKCFGKWRNDTVVCGGGHELQSHGNCTAHDECACDENYQETSSCGWDCYGEGFWKDESCGEFGICIDHDSCNCSTSEYTGTFCDVPTCALIAKGEDGVCSGHGECNSPDNCDCDPGYFSERKGYCDHFTCNGVMWDKKESVCSAHGKCVDYDECECDGGYEESDCEDWSCGKSKDHAKTCNGHGKCQEPETCSCSTGYAGDLCETNTLYSTVMAPTLSVGGLTGILIFCIIIICCCCCCCFVFCTSVLLIGGLGVYLLTQTFRWKKLSKLKNVDVLLREQEADENTSIAHIRVNRGLFEVDYKDIKITKILGEGGSNSTVYLSNWKNRKVAFKCFKTRMICSSQDSFDEFEREAAVFASISHPNIVAFYGCTLDPPRVGILMEYCEKGECFEFILKWEVVNNGRYPMKERFRMLFEICSSMDYLHSKSIIHRDLKCENVLLNRNEECKLMDFGLARITHSLAQKQTKGVGTSFYMAPEVTTGGFYNEKCDVFSFAIMAFVIISGNGHPYGQEAISVEFKVSQDPKYRPDANEMKEFLKEEDMWVIGVTQKCWDHDSNVRPGFGELCELFEEKREEEEKKSSIAKQVDFEQLFKKEEEEIGDRAVVGEEEVVVDDKNNKNEERIRSEEIIRKLKEENEELKNALEMTEGKLKESRTKVEEYEMEMEKLKKKE